MVAQLVKTLAAKSDELKSIPCIHVVEAGEPGPVSYPLFNTCVMVGLCPSTKQHKKGTMITIIIMFIIGIKTFGDCQVHRDISLSNADLSKNPVC